MQGNPTFAATTQSKEEIIDNRMSVLSSTGLSMKDVDYDLPLLYCIPQLHKCPYKQRYMITGATKCSIKPLSEMLTSIFTAVKTGLQKYHDVNQMWILKNSKDLLETLSSRSQYVCNSIKTFDFSTLYITFSHTTKINN